MIHEAFGEGHAREIVQSDKIASLIEEGRIRDLEVTAIARVQSLRKEGTGPSAFDNASRAIDTVINELKQDSGITDADVATLYQRLNKVFLEPLAQAEARPGILGTPGRTDWHVPPTGNA